MSKKVFLSFRQKNVDLRNDLLALFAAGGGRIQATPVYLTEDLRGKGEAAITKQIQEAMQDCCGLLLVMGEDVHNSEWIKYELEVADSWGIPRVGVRHRQATGGPPNRYPRLEILPWQPETIAQTVNSWQPRKGP